MVTTGNYEIIASGSYLTFDQNSDLYHDVFVNDERILGVRYELDEGEKDDGPDIFPSFDKEKGIVTFRVTNFVGMSSFGLKDPYMMAIFDGEKIFIRFWITRIGVNQVAKRLDYSVYMEKSENG